MRTQSKYLNRNTPHYAVDAVDRAVDDEEADAGLRYLGPRVFDHTGSAVAGKSIRGSVARVSKEQIPFFVRLVRDASERLSGALATGLIRRLFSCSVSEMVSHIMRLFSSSFCLSFAKSRESARPARV